VKVLEREGIPRFTLTDANNFKKTLSNMDCNVSHWLLESAAPHFVYDNDLEDFAFCSLRDPDSPLLDPVPVKSFAQVARGGFGGASGASSMPEASATDTDSGVATMCAYLKGLATSNKHIMDKQVHPKDPIVTNEKVSCSQGGTDFQRASLWDCDNTEMISFFTKYSLPIEGLVISDMTGADMKELIYGSDNFLQAFLLPPPVGLGFKHCLVYTVRFRKAVMREFGINLPRVNLETCQP
jgi:hypothetical protein